MQPGNQNTNNSRNRSIDMLRIICALAVVMIHMVTAPVSAAGGSGAVDPRLSGVLQLLHDLLRFAVPVFFMISGYCVPGSRKDCGYAWVFPHVLRLLAVLGTYGFALALLARYYEARVLSPALAARAAEDVLCGRLWDHMWFVYALAGLYLVYPVLFQMLQCGRESDIFLGLLFFAGVLVPWIGEVTGITPALDFPVTGYVCYVYFGAWTARRARMGQRILPVRAAMLCTALGAAGIAARDLAGGPSLRYLSLPVCLAACGIFSLAVRPGRRERADREAPETKTGAGSAVVRELAEGTFGCYLFHPVFLQLLIRGAHVQLLSGCAPLRLFAAFMLVAAASFAAAGLLRKVPLLSRVL